MRRSVLALAAASLVALAATPAHADGRMLHFTVDLGAAVPFGPGLKETTFRQFPVWHEACSQPYQGVTALCNPAVAGFDAGLAFHYQFPFYLGLGLGYKMTVFGRTADPLAPGTNEPNEGDTAPFVAHRMNVIVKLRILDMVRHFKDAKQMGSLDLDLGVGYTRLYGVEDFVHVSQTLAYSWPVKPVFRIGVYIGIVEAIALNERRTLEQRPWTEDGKSGVIEITEGALHDFWMHMGLRMEFSFVSHDKEAGEGDEEFAEGESEYAEQMKLTDTDGDGLSDYDEMMLGTSNTEKDSDGDTLPDGIEDANLNGIRDPGETDPTKKDTDDGGASDGWEVSNGYDPLDFDDDDRDVDGVVDEFDACPGTPPGTEVGDSGCPTLTEAVQLDQVTFVEGTAELNPEAYTQLDQYAMILLQDPSMEVVVLVFGPPTGNKKKLDNLTEEQAQAIKDYLVLRGIEDWRIVATGMGKSPDGPRVELQPIIPMF
jgi:outer membrane protein OmpA-like peptidoglycan-associated protein